MVDQAGEANFHFELPMGTPEIERCIPHRYPFLLIDRVLAYSVGEYIHATKNISISDGILQGHFPGDPVVPGVIIVEGMAQASAVLGRLTSKTESAACLLMEIQQTRFRRKVVPGDTLDYFVRIVKSRGNFLWFEGEAKVDGELATSCKFSAKIGD